MVRYRISPLAEQDLEAIGDFIAQDNPHRALTFIAELRELQPDELSPKEALERLYQLKKMV